MLGNLKTDNCGRTYRTRIFIFVKISSNPLKIISQIKLNWNPIGWKNILYGEENFHFCKLLFICSSLQKLPCSRIFHGSEKNLAQFLFRMFQNRHFPKPDSSLILHCSRNFIIFLLICFTARSLHTFGSDPMKYQ